MGRVFRYRVRDQAGQLSGVEHAQFMQGAGRSHIEQFGVTVVRGVIFPGGVKDQYRVKLQPFGVVYRQHHDAVSEDCFLQVTLDVIQIEGQFLSRTRGGCKVTADDGNGIPALLPPVLTSIGDGPDQRHSIRQLFDLYGIAMTKDRFHRVDEETTMP